MSADTRESTGEAALHRRRVGRRRGRPHVRGSRSVQRRARGRGRGGLARGRAPRRRGGRRRRAGLGADAAGRAPGHLPQGRGRAREPPATRSSRCSRARPASTFGFGMFQMHFVPGLFRQTAALAYSPIGEVIPSDTGAFAMGLRRPVGVVGAIAPWNAALILSARSIAAPLALGNTVVLKPSEWSPIVGGLIWGEIFAEAGLPEGVLNIVTNAPGEAAPDRRRAGREPARAPAQLHRLDRHRPQARRGRRPAAQARRARARRLQPADRARRRRHRVRGQRDGLRRVPAPGPDLHVGAPDHRRALDRRRVRLAPRREDERPQGRRPERARHDHRAAHQRRRAARWSSAASTAR